MGHACDLGFVLTRTPCGTASLTFEAVERLKHEELRHIALTLDGVSTESHDGLLERAAATSSRLLFVWLFYV
ncbi:MAG: hypothetical protein ACLFMT_03305, partial [Halobacteriales archaeon]